MTKFINAFLNDEDGAVTVDWVVLTAAIVGLGIAAITSVQGGIVGLGDAIATDLETTDYVGSGIPEDDAGDGS